MVGPIKKQEETKVKNRIEITNQMRKRYWSGETKRNGNVWGIPDESELDWSPSGDTPVSFPERSTFGYLPFDVLGHMSNSDPVLSHTMALLDRRTRRAVEGRRTAFTVTEKNIERVMANLASPDRVHLPAGVYLRLPNFPPGVREKIVGLYNKALPTEGFGGFRARLLGPGGVYALHITIQKEDIRDKGYEAVASILVDIIRGLYSTPFLEELELDLSDLSSSPWDTKVGLAGSRVFGLLGIYAPKVQRLTLELSGNEVGDLGVYALCDVLQSYSLKKLHLGLKNNHIGPEGVSVLVHRLRESATLESLHLDLEDNPIGDDGALWLSALGIGNAEAVSGLNWSMRLHTLHLVCTNNGIGNDGAGYFRMYCGGSADNPTQLHHLHLDLDQNRIGARGLRAMERMRTNADTQLDKETLQIHTADQVPSGV
jgi:hypothetical protein